MKKQFLLLFLLWVTALQAQQAEQIQQDTPPLYLEYDPAGNQTISDLVCINCPEEGNEQALTPVAKAQPPLNDALSRVRYAPNPTIETLTISWENTDTSKVTDIGVYALSGKQVAFKKNLNRHTQLSLPFGALPSGIYTVALRSSDGRSKSFKVVKQ